MPVRQGDCQDLIAFQGSYRWFISARLSIWRGTSISDLEYSPVFQARATGLWNLDRCAELMNITDMTMIAATDRMRDVSGSCANQLPRKAATRGLT